MTNTTSGRGVCLVGAGYISSVHAEALRALDVPIAAVVDPNLAAREKLASAFAISNTYASIEQALNAGGFERAHLLVPPDMHGAAALPLLRARKALLVEKPLAPSLANCDEMISLAAEQAVPLGVNQNFVHHPAFVRLCAAVADFALGKPRFVDVVYHAPLRQLASRQFGHWMFREPRNILLEQAVHPLSQIVQLCGDIEALEAIGGATIDIAPNAKLVPSFTAALAGSLAPAALRFAVGQDFPFWQVSVLCDDGVLFADILANRFWTIKRTRWMDAVDGHVSGQASAFGMARSSWRNFIDYGLSAMKLRGRSDSFFQSMKKSIGAFHESVDAGRAPPLDGGFGRTLVALCDRIAAQIMPTVQATEAKRQASMSSRCDVAVLGGTGFIGTSVVTRLRAAGLTVSVMARNLTNLPAIFQDEGVQLHRGDIRSIVDVRQAIAGVARVVNLAHGGGGGSWEEIRDAMVGGAETVAQACLQNGSVALIYVGSIAALYLGSQAAPVTGATRSDPQAARRAEYARAKALCEERLLRLQRDAGLALCILRPGLVVGAGTSPFHSGLGFYNNEQHCIGWNAGRNPLPFVLVDDVADAIVAACTRPVAGGRSYNLVGDFRPSARDFLAELARTLHRPLRFHPKSANGLYLNELGKWCVKRLGGRRVAAPSLRDIRSRGLLAEFDCSDAKNDLDWQPVADEATFYRRAFAGLGEP